MQLRNIFLFKIIIFLLLLGVLLISIIMNNIFFSTSLYKGNEEIIRGYVTKISLDNSKLTINLNTKEKVLVNYYISTNLEKNNIFNEIKLGDYLEIYGKLSIPSDNTNFNMFNYRKYLKNNGIYYIFKMQSFKKIKNNTNILYFLKQKVVNRINSFKYSSSYIFSFILGDASYISDNDMNSYRKIGIAHLFSISGMHISLIILLLSKFLNKTNKIFKNIFIVLFMLFYLFLINFSVTALRACLFALFLRFNKKKNLFSNIEIVVIVYIILLIINPMNLYNMGLQISIIVCFFLVLFSKFIASKNKIKSLFLVSFISYISTIPIMVYYFGEINLISIFANVLFVPFVSYILFPLSIITFVFPVFDFLLYALFNIFSFMTNFINSFSLFRLSFAKPNIIIIILYYVLLLLFYKNKKFIFLFISILIIHYNIIYFNDKYCVYYFDVGQGDSALISFPHNSLNILIDTGGKVNYCDSELGCSNYSLATQLIVPSLNRLGIKNLDYLIISHGDYDHMGEAINLVNNFKVKNVVFNCGEFNELEKELIKVLDKKKIKYYSCIKELNIDNNKLYFLQTKEYDNENDNSNVIYTELDGYKFMFMGDAGVEKEKDILNKYNISGIDILKIGHHGSKTSSSKEFINEINPNYSIISVGKNNRYGHPNKEVLNNLSDSKIYRTDQDGSIMFKIKNYKLKIETCVP